MPLMICNCENRLIILDGFEPDPFEKSSIANDILRLMIFEATPNARQLGIDFKSEGYDLIFVDWSDGRTFLQRNAFVLEEVLKEINRRKGLSGCMGALQKCDVKNISNGSLPRTDIFGAGAEILNATLSNDELIPRWWGFIRKKFTASVRVKSVGPNSVVYEGEFSIKGSGGYTVLGIIIRPNSLISTAAKVTMSSSPSLVTDHAAGGMTSLVQEVVVN